MDYDKLIEDLKQLEFVAYNHNINGEVLGMDCTEFESVMADATTAIEILCADLSRVTAERDAAIKKYEAEKEDFLDYALSGIQNAAPFCMNRQSDCVDKRGWCIPVRCHGFSRDRED